MQDVFICFQIFMMIICSCVLIVAMSQKEGNITKILICICMFGLVNNAGYLFELMAENADEAIMAIRGEYMGGAFITTFLLVFTLHYCGYDISEKLQNLLYFFNFTVHMNVIFCEHTQLYYKGWQYVEGDYINYLAVEKGPLYYINIVYVVSALVVCMIAAIRAMKRTEDREKRITYKYVLASILIPLVMYVIGLSGIIKEFDPVPSSIAFSILVYGIAISKRQLVDVVTMANNDVVGNMKMPIIVIDYDMHFIQANKAAIKIFAVLNDYKKGQRLPEKYFNDIIGMKNRDKSNELEYEGRWYDTQVTVLSERYGKTEGYVISMFDLTEEKQKLEMMRRLKQAADDMTRAKSDFLARMSHEIRTPINSISGVLEMILRDSCEPNIRSCAAGAKSATQSLLGIINDILDTSKIEAGKMELENVEYSFGELLYAMIRMSQMRTMSKGLQFVFNVDRNMPSYYYGDSIRLKQVIVNILGNAFKYTKEGSVTLNVTGKRDGEYEEITIEVADTGIGIKEEDMPKLFEAFERIDMDNNRNIEGTGLGMSISLKILSLMDSKLEVESKYGEGSRFWFTVRQKIASEEPLEDFEVKYEEQQQNRAMNGMYIAPEANILVVDDNDINRTVFRGLLKNTQINIEDVNSGKGCLEIIKEKHFDIIFMDHMMPEMDGIETFKIMRSSDDHKCKDTPVIMLTANAIGGAEKEYRDIGFDDYMTKPIDTTELLGVIRRILPQHMIKEQKPQMRATMNGPAMMAGGPPMKAGGSPMMAGGPPMMAGGQPMKAGGQPMKAGGPPMSGEISDVLPDIEDVNWKVALLNIPEKDIVKMTAVDFCKSIDREMAKISEYFESLSQPESLDRYRIQVHALKSTAAMIGAMQLSGLAKLLEFAAKENNIERIKALHPVLMEELPKYKERLSVLDDEEKQEKETLNDNVKLTELLEEMKQAMEERDFNKSDSISEQLSEYQYDDNIKELVDTLMDQALNMQAYAAIETVDKLLEIV